MIIKLTYINIINSDVIVTPLEYQRIFIRICTSKADPIFLMVSVLVLLNIESRFNPNSTTSLNLIIANINVYIK